MVPLGNFTVRGEAALAAASADAVENVAAGSDAPSATQRRLNWRRLSNCWFITSNRENLIDAAYRGRIGP